MDLATQGDGHKALNRATRAPEVHRFLRDLVDEAHLHRLTAWYTAPTEDRLGHPRAVLGRYHRARVAWQEALELYQERGLDADAARVEQRLDDLAARELDQEAESLTAFPLVALSAPSRCG